MDQWPSVMYDTYHARGGFGFALFPIAIILGTLLALTSYPSTPTPAPAPTPTLDHYQFS